MGLVSPTGSEGGKRLLWILRKVQTQSSSRSQCSGSGGTVSWQAAQEVKAACGQDLGERNRLYCAKIRATEGRSEATHFRHCLANFSVEPSANCRRP